MAYIGKTPVIGNFVKLDAITAVNGQAAYTMQNGGSNFTDYESVNQFLVSLNGTIQAPTDSFTVSGSTLTFASNLSTGDVIDFIMVFGNSLSAGTPTDGTVSLAKLSATGTKNSTTFLRGDNTFAAAGLNGWSENGSNNDLLPASASAGIYLGVNSATAANLLDDYEEGTFTPVLSFGGGTTGITYDQQFGNYTKIGRLVHIKMRIKLSSKGSSTGDAVVNGFPFSPADDFSAVSFEKGKEFDTWTGMNTASNYRFVHTESNDMQIKRIDTNAVQSFATTVSHNDFTDTSDMRVTYTYST